MYKKVIIALLCACTLLSCQNEAGNEGPEEVVLPEIPGVFHATIEGAGSKVYTDDKLHVLWNSGDCISIFEKTTRNKKYSFTGPDGANGGDFEDATSTFGTGDAIDFNYAVYPYLETTSYVYDDVIRTVFPEEQQWTENSFGPGANLMVAKSSTKDLSFKNAGAYLCLKLYGEGYSVRSVILTGNASETLAGPVKISFDSDRIPSLSFDESAPMELSRQIVLKATEPVQLASSEADATVFWMVVPPVPFPSGFTITIIDDEGGIHVKSTSKSTTFERNTRIVMKVFAIDDNTEPLLTAAQLGIYPMTRDAYVYDKTTTQVNVAEVEGNAWVRFISPASLSMTEIGPIPAGIAKGDRLPLTIDTYESGAKTNSEGPCIYTVQSTSGGILNLVSDEGTRIATHF